MAVLCAALVPAAAFGSTVGKSGTTLTYTASPTENNGLAITDDGTFYVFDEVGGVTVSVAAGSGCVSFGANTAKCSKTGITGFTIDMKEGTNSATLSVPLPATFIGTTGSDDFTGNSGADTFTLGTGTNEASGAGGNDTFNSASGVDELIGGAGDDVFKQGTAADGADHMIGGSGTDTTEYNQRTASLTIVQDDDPGDGAAGENDQVEDDVEIVKAGSGSDMLSGGPCASVLYGGGGTDTLNGTAASFRLCRFGIGSDSDNDTLFGEAGNDTLNGGADDDSLDGGSNDDTLNGGSGNDALTGGSGADVLNGLGTGGTDIGIDTAYFSVVGFGASVTIDDVANDTTENDNVKTDVENLTMLGSAAANFVGSDVANVLTGGSGNDELHGGDGVDTLSGADGDDTLDGGATDSDNLFGGNGTDRASYLARNAQITATLNGLRDDGGNGEDDLIAADIEGIVGGDDFDTLTGNNSANYIDGSRGSDEIFGLDGDDTLRGGATRVDPEGGNFDHDTIQGGPGNDSINGGQGGDFVYAGPGDDTVQESGGFFNSYDDPDVVRGEEGNDWLDGDEDGDDVNGGPGNDILVDTDHNADLFFGADGTDTYRRTMIRCDPLPCTGNSVSFDNNTNDGPDGEDNVRSDVENATIVAAGGAFSNDTLKGDDRVNILIGGGGTDTITGGAGSDVLDARSPDATGGSTLSGDDGADTIYGGNGPDTINGGSNNDTIDGGLGADAISGGTHSGAIIGFGGGDTVTYAAYAAGVTVSLDGAANDGTAGEGDNVQADVENVVGTPSNDTIKGGTGNVSNIFTAGSGNDSLDGGPGPDQLDGGVGTDTVDYSTKTAAITVNLAVVGGDGTVGEGDDVVAVENVTGGSAGDVLTGTDGANLILGGGGADTMNGAAGNDSFEGGTGGDIMNGGDGFDFVDYAARAVAITADLEGDTDDGQAGENDRIGADVENIAGGSGNDSLIGNAAANALTGNLGNDTFTGGLGADNIQGGDGNDRLAAGAVADGNDQFSGGAGVDEADYSLRAGAVTLDLTSGVADGESGEGDSISSDTETLKGGLGDDVLKGGASVAHTVLGGPGNDLMTGGTRDDILVGGPGGDRFASGGAQDRADYSARIEPLTIDQDGVADDGGFLEGDNVLGDITLVFGGSGDDRITGSATPNILAGGPGNDRLNGAAANDTLRGDAGNDVLEADPNKDDLVGGEGVDTADYSARTGALVITLDNLDNDGDPTFPPAGENDNVLDDIENVLGGSGNDSITGDADANFLRGGLGSDTLRGMAGDDRLHSRDGGADTLVDCGVGAADVHAADATDAAGTGCEVRQDATFSPPVNTEAPELFGTPEIGQTFTATAGTFTGVEPIAYEFQWLRCDPGCVEIQGASAQTYVAAAPDLSKTLAARVRASNEDGTGVAQSAVSEPITLGAPPDVVLADMSTTEGDDGMTAIAFEITLSRAHMTPVTVDWATGDGTAEEPGDYTAASGTVTFAVGDTSETVAVQVLGDLVDETDETFVVDFTNATNAALPDTQAVGTITDDDSAPSAVTAAATGIGQTAATLNGTVAANGRDTTYWFEYGLTTAYGSETAHTELAPDANLAVSALVESLAPGTPYHYRLVATSVSGAAQGTDQTLTTASAPPPPPPPTPPPPTPPPPPPPPPPAPQPQLRPPAQTRCVVPNVKGKTVARARQALAAARCSLGKVTRAYSGKVKSGRIISQSKRPAARLARGTKVNVVVSRGKRK